MDEEQGIYCGEVQDIIGALAEIDMAVLRLSYMEGDDDEEETEEDRPSDA